MAITIKQPDEKPRRDQLAWTRVESFMEAILGDFHGGDGVRFTVVCQPTCYRRGPYRLVVEVAPGVNHYRWGCFDEADQPMRWYHRRPNALSEAQAIAEVLWRDRHSVD